MNWLSLFGFAPPSRTRHSGARSRRRLLVAELLEDRCVPAVFNVNSLADVLSPGPGVVTLRSAIQQANQTPGGNTINLTVPGTYRITLPGTPGETDNAAGEFAIGAGGGDLSIVNTSGGKVTTDGGGHNRLFDINPGFSPANPTATFTATLQGLTITDGLATGGANPDGPDASGGGIRDQGNASLTLIDDVVTDNAATADGGGVAMENAVSVPWTLTVQNSVISNNRAGDAGGGIDSDGAGKVFVTDSTVTGNSAVNQGGGIWLDAVQAGNVFQTANLTVTGSLISNNTSITAATPATGNDGGGIGNAGNGTVTVVGSTVANNFTGGVGGGFGDTNGQGTLVVQDSTFVNNVALGDGGGIEASGPMTTISDTTITGNESLAQGGGLAVTSTSFTLDNTVVTLDQANGNGGMNFQGTAPDVVAAVTTGRGDFIGIGDAGLSGIGNGSDGNRVGTSAAPLDPLLGPLQNNGGPTPTRAPLPGSPVIDAGLNAAIAAGLTADQRGFNRVVNHAVDVGAVEFQPPATTLTLGDSAGTANLGQPVTFTATVTAQAPGSNTPQGTVTFAVDGVPQGTAALVNGVATFTTPTMSAGPHTVTATYGGDVNFTSSTASLAETVLGLRDVTGLVTVTRVLPRNRHGKRVRGNPARRTFEVTNRGGAAIQGPVYLVLDRLTRGIRLRNATGFSRAHGTPGDPFVLLSPGPLGPGRSVTVTLLFGALNRKRLPLLLRRLGFIPLVLAGPGTV